MFNNILLPIDLDLPTSWDRALPIARGLLNPGGKLHLLSVIHDVGNAWVATYLPKGFEAKVLSETKDRLEAFVTKEIGDHKDVSTHLGYGHVAETIVNIAKKTKADLIVMSSRSPDELRTFRVGSQGDRVVRYSPISVMVVR